ncbi:MAG TPA: VOC family protein [Chthoniobacterales bacterium]|nr:VOC family protein [Chthoniobacterales bacterium]
MAHCDLNHTLRNQPPGSTLLVWAAEASKLIPQLVSCSSGVMQKITPFLWFDSQAEEAVQFYLSIFKDAKIHATTRYPEGGPGTAGAVMTIAFELNGEQFVALNGGPGYPFTQAVSLVVNCETQEEIDYFWAKLAADGGEHIQCGWLKDKFGFHWQIVPTRIWELLHDKDPAVVKRVTSAVWQMEKLDLAALERAAAD